MRSVDSQVFFDHDDDISLNGSSTDISSNISTSKSDAVAEVQPSSTPASTVQDSGLRLAQVDSRKTSGTTCIKQKSISIQTKPPTRDAWTQCDYDDIYQLLGSDPDYARRESTPIAATPQNCTTRKPQSSFCIEDQGSHDDTDISINLSHPSASIEDISSIQNISFLSEYQPTPGTTSDDDQTASSLDTSMNTTSPSVVQEKKFIVFESCLDQLFQRCSVCGKGVLNTRKFVVGSCLSIITECCADHTIKWSSQPNIRGMASGNLLLPASILFSGGSYNKFYHLSELLNLQIISSSEFYRIQDAYLFPVVAEAWKLHQETVFAVLEGNPLNVSGDGRCDSPGFSAKYGSYTVMDNESGAVIDFQLVQCSEVANSHAMEKAGLQRSLQNMNENGIQVNILATDRHPQIAHFMKTEHPNIQHQYDVWHVAKNIAKKLAKKAASKSCSSLVRWIPSVTNHLWWSAATCNHDASLLQEKWTSIIHHTANIHNWTGNNKFHQCSHPALSATERQTKQWLKVGSKAHDTLKDVVLDKKLLKDIRQLTLFCHTGDLEAYHAMLTKYCPKREHFCYKGMLARLQLAALDHNMNLQRKQATTKAGEHRFRLVHPKSKKEWVVKPIYEKKEYSHLQDLMLDTVNLRQSEKEPIKGRKARKADVELPDTIARVEKPDKSESIKQHRTRMTRHS